MFRSWRPLALAAAVVFTAGLGVATAQTIIVTNVPPGAKVDVSLAARAPEQLTSVVLLDPAIQILPHVGFDFAQEAALDHSFATVEAAIESRLTSGSPTPREFVEEEAREHLVPSPDGRLRWQFCRAAVVTAYSELCTEPPSPSALRVPALLVHASQFGLVRDEQLDEYASALGEQLELVAVPGGHVVYWDAFDQTAAAVEKFLLHHGHVSHP
jgi:lipase